MKEELHALVDRLTDDDAALEYVRWLHSPGESLSDVEFSRARSGEAETARGEYVTLTEFSRSLGE